MDGWGVVVIADHLRLFSDVHPCRSGPDGRIGRVDAARDPIPGVRPSDRATPWGWLPVSAWPVMTCNHCQMSTRLPCRQDSIRASPSRRGWRAARSGIGVGGIEELGIGLAGIDERPMGSTSAPGAAEPTMDRVRTRSRRQRVAVRWWCKSAGMVALPRLSCRRRCPL